MHILEVALSRFMCCSLVCNAIRKAKLSSESFETPIILPGIFRLYRSFDAKKAACGPPNPIGTPKRCEEPKTTSAPISPGDFNKESANKSVATATCMPFECQSDMMGSMLRISPNAVGY